MDNTTLLLWISILWASIHLFRRLLTGKRASPPPNLPPGPSPLPIIGNLHKLIGNKPNESLTQLANTYGPLMTLRLGQVTNIVVSSAAMAKEVLQKHDRSLSGRSVNDAIRGTSYPESSIVWLPPNDKWRRLRMLSNSYVFSSQRLDASEALRRRKVTELLSHVSQCCREGRAVNIGRVAFATVLNVIFNTIFSVDLVDIDSESTQEFKELVWEALQNAGTPNLVDFFPSFGWIDPQGIRRKGASIVERLRVIFRKIYEERLQSGAKRDDFLEAILDHMEVEKGTEFNINEMGGSFVDFFVAGSGTTSDTIEWAMAELLHNPEAMKRVRCELAEVLGSRKMVEESDLSALPYLQAITKETLRLHLPAPLLVPHRAESDVQICGFHIPKHTRVLINAWAISRDAQVWPEPTSFKPERFLCSEVDYKGRDFEFIPFGGGRRICPGLPLAVRMINLTLASLLNSFSWELPDGMDSEDMDMSDKFGIVLQKAIPLLVVPIQGEAKIAHV